MMATQTKGIDLVVCSKKDANQVTTDVVDFEALLDDYEAETWSDGNDDNEGKDDLNCHSEVEDREEDNSSKAEDDDCEIIEVVAQGGNSGGERTVNPNSHLELVLSMEEFGHHQLLPGSDPGGDNANNNPKSFPTKPKDCLHHVIPLSVYSDELLRRFPANLFAKRQLQLTSRSPQIQVVNMSIERKNTQLYLTPVIPDEMPTLSHAPRASGYKAPVICQFCHKSYKQAGNLKKHYRIKHNFLSR